MLFNVYGDNAIWQLLGCVLVFVALIVLNEIARRSKAGGLALFVVVPVILTIYFIVVAVCAKKGIDWAVNNQTTLYMNGWFHYAKLYAALAGCIGFMMIKYDWGIGKKEGFKVFPFVIVAINILIAVASDFESAIKGSQALAETGTRYFYSNENVWIYGGWWNWVNGIAGLVNIFCMTGWWGIYKSKDGRDMLWPDMTWPFILAYDVWNFEYVYLNQPTHSWYCGIALLLAPTIAAAYWNKGAWMQNRAFTLAFWCMFCTACPFFEVGTRFAVSPSLYGSEIHNQLELSQLTSAPEYADPRAQGVVAIAALVINLLVLGAIIRRAILQKKNPYKQEIFTDTKDYIAGYKRISE